MQHQTQVASNERCWCEVFECSHLNVWVLVLQLRKMPKDKLPSPFVVISVCIVVNGENLDAILKHKE